AARALGRAPRPLGPWAADRLGDRRHAGLRLPAGVGGSSAVSPRQGPLGRPYRAAPAAWVYRPSTTAIVAPTRPPGRARGGRRAGKGPCRRHAAARRWMSPP